MGCGQEPPTSLLEEMSPGEGGQGGFVCGSVFFFNLLNQDNLTPLPTTLNSASTLDQAASVRRLSRAGRSGPHRL